MKRQKKEAVQQRQAYEQEQNIKLVNAYISRLDVQNTYR